MDQSESVVIHVSNQGSRKRKKHVSPRENAKKMRYSTPSGSNVFTPCKHNNKAFKCFKIRPNDALDFR